MKLVKFDDGTYGVRRGNWPFGYTFLDMRDRSYWWGAPENVVKNCKASEAEARASMSYSSTKHKVIK